ncbi:MAG TPA: hypothetical protein DDW84_00145 [Phycisphaerales bacterium]|nr:MAG: hypothetical protein A2Y13_02010 [Planctomycetes bacterium GWC2_45_44]HBG77247.1 hypothetical protein [Phycisphaerales bacterium]HBR19196.1 hypothetical protein [Phycisphaerales bacterium]
MNSAIPDKATQEAIQFDRFMLGVNTAIPAVIISFDTTTRLAKVRPAIALKIVQPDKVEFINLPIIENVPVCLPHSRSAGLYLTVPICPGDECLLIFSQRAIDNFVELGGIVTPPVGNSPATSCVRHHDLTDAICIPGIITMPQTLTGWNNSAIEVRSGNGATKVSVYADKVDVQTTTVNIIAGDVNVTGDIHVTGGIDTTGDVVAGTISLKSHLHSGVQPGGGNTGVPVP